jgi:hypothetical protein
VRPPPLEREHDEGEDDRVLENRGRVEPDVPSNYVRRRQSTGERTSESREAIRIQDLLVGVALEEQAQHGQHDDLDVEHQRPVFNVVDIVNGAIDDGRGTP